MIREIIRPRSSEYIVHIPSEYINKEVEILILPLNLEEEGGVKKIDETIFSKTAGILRSKKINPIKWQQEIRNEWEDRV